MFKKNTNIFVLVIAILVMFSLPALGGWPDATGPGDGDVGSLFYEGKVEAERICTSTLLEKVRPTSDARDSYSEVPGDWDFALIDTRSREEYEQGHINGAINMPKDGAFIENLLPDDKDKQIIFYGVDCYEWMYETKEAGYENLYIYDADIEGWKARADYLTTTPQYVSELIAEESISNKDRPHYILIDTRGFGMYFESHIPTAQSMPHTLFEDKYLDYLPADKETEIITYCGGFFWGHSHAVARVLASEGYTNVKVLAGGTPAWEENGSYFLGTDVADIEIAVDDDGAQAIDEEKFVELVEEGTTVLDVRNDDEIDRSGLITGAIHIPVGALTAAPSAFAGALPDDISTPIVVHCAAGVRARDGADALVDDLGYENVYYLDGRIRVSEDGSYSF